MVTREALLHTDRLEVRSRFLSDAETRRTSIGRARNIDVRWRKGRTRGRTRWDAGSPRCSSRNDSPQEPHRQVWTAMDRYGHGRIWVSGDSPLPKLLRYMARNASARRQEMRTRWRTVRSTTSSKEAQTPWATTLACSQRHRGLQKGVWECTTARKRARCAVADASRSGSGAGAARTCAYPFPIADSR